MSLYSSINDVMERFDFDKVHKVMTFLNWTWATTTGGTVPSIDELKACAYQLLHLAVQSHEERGRPLTGSNVATGGFEAAVVVYDSGRAELCLLFYVDSKSQEI